MINLTSIPQKFSRDLYVRLRAHELRQLELAHLYSEVFATPPREPICGSTEWHGFYCGEAISMGWDWVVRADGIPRYSTSQMLRSNIMLVSDKGYDLGPEMTSAKCEEAVRSIPWCSAVTKILRNRMH